MPKKHKCFGLKTFIKRCEQANLFLAVFSFQMLYLNNYWPDFHRINVVALLMVCTCKILGPPMLKVKRRGHRGEKWPILSFFSPFARCNFKTTQGIFTKPSLFYTSWGLVVNQYGRQGERSKVKVTEVKNGQFWLFFAFCTL